MVVVPVSALVSPRPVSPQLSLRGAASSSCLGEGQAVPEAWGTAGAGGSPNGYFTGLFGSESKLPFFLNLSFLSGNLVCMQNNLVFRSFSGRPCFQVHFLKRSTMQLHLFTSQASDFSLGNKSSVGLGDWKIHPRQRTVRFSTVLHAWFSAWDSLTSVPHCSLGNWKKR